MHLQAVFDMLPYDHSASGHRPFPYRQKSQS